MKLSLKRAVQTVQDGVRTQLWPLPVLGVILAVAAGVLVPLLDVRLDTHLSGLLNTLIFNGDPGAARTVLSAVASSLITVTSLTFSLTVVTLQLASSQFSPRLLRTFTQDLFVQVTLAIFLATFTFSLTVLRSVRSPSEGGAVFVPRLSVTVAFLLALASVVALVLFLAHLTRQIRVETMLQRVYDDAASTMATNLTRHDDPDANRSTPERPAGGTHVLMATSSGFLTSIDQDDLLDAATAADAVVAIERHPGSFVVKGTPLGHAWSRGGDLLGSDELDRLRKKVAATVNLGPERTAAQDVGYGLRQVTDIVNKALSPGINDPTTAIHGLGQTSALLSELTDYDLGPLVLHDDHDQPRIVLHRPGFPALLELAVSQPRSYGESDPQVLGRLYEVLTDLAWHSRPEHHQPVLDQLRRLDDTTSEQDLDDTETARLSHLSQDVRSILTRAGTRPATANQG